MFHNIIPLNIELLAYPAIYIIPMCLNVNLQNDDDDERKTMNPITKSVLKDGLNLLFMQASEGRD